MRSLERMLTASVVAVLILGVDASSAADEKNIVRFGAAFVSPTGDLTVNGFFVEELDPSTRIEFQGDLLLEPDDALGFWLEYERRVTRRVGVDVTLMRADHDVRGTLDGTLFLIDNTSGAILEQESFRETADAAEIDLMPLTAGVNYHLTPQRAVDIYVGAFLAYVMYGDLDFDDESIPIDDETTLGAVVGVDVSLGKERWGFSGALRYLSTEAEPDESGPDAMAVGVDPWIVQAGAVYRF